MGLSILKKAYGGGFIEIGEWDTDTDTPPTYSSEYFDPGDVVKIAETISLEKIEAKTWYTGMQTTMVTDVITVGYELDIELGQIDQDILAIALMGEKVGLHEILALTKPLGVYAIKFTPRYPRGQKWGRHWWKCNLELSGSRELIASDYMTVALKVTGLIDSTNHSTNPWFESIEETS